jgi:hypothetical protein
MAQRYFLKYLSVTFNLAQFVDLEESANIFFWSNIGFGPAIGATASGSVCRFANAPASSWLLFFLKVVSEYRADGNVPRPVVI